MATSLPCAGSQTLGEVEADKKNKDKERPGSFSEAQIYYTFPIFLNVPNLLSTKPFFFPS